MTKQADFSYEEWDIIADITFLTGLAVSKADYSAAGQTCELAALSDICKKTGEKFPGNELIQALLADRSPEDSDEEYFDEMSIEELLERLDRILEIIDRKAPADEARELREFLYQIAGNIALVYSEGFMGFGKKKSRKEGAFLDLLKDRLKLT